MNPDSLRKRVGNKDSLQRLARLFGKRSGLSLLKRYPLSRLQWAGAVVLIIIFMSASGLGIRQWQRAEHGEARLFVLAEQGGGTGWIGVEESESAPEKRSNTEGLLHLPVKIHLPLRKEWRLVFYNQDLQPAYTVDLGLINENQLVRLKYEEAEALGETGDQRAIEGKNVFNDIAQEIIKSKKRTVAIIDFPNKDGKKIEEGENVAKNLGVILNQKIGIDNVWIESGKSLMNILEKNRIIENGKITNKELAKRLWRKMGIEAVITGVLDPHINGIGFSIELYDVQDDKVIHQFKGKWLRKDAVTMKGIQLPESTGTSRSAWTPPTPSDYQEISQHFLNSHEHATLADVGNALQAALENAGFKTTYLALPEGFALVSNVDEFQFSFDGISTLPQTVNVVNFFKVLEDLGRNPLKTFFKGWISGSPKQKFYRVVCVIVTSGDVWGQNQMTFEEAQKLFTFGKATIPEALQTQQYIPEVLQTQQYIEGKQNAEEKYKCMALLYVFEKDPSGDEIRFVPLSDKRIHIRDHLQETGFWDNP